MGFNPVRLGLLLEGLVSRTRGGVVERRYWRFRYTRHYGGNAAGDVVGCNLRCAFCWAWPYAFKARVGRFHSPRDAASRLAAIARSGRARLARLTGGEPTIAWPHTRAVAELLLAAGYTFILETNGILIGAGVVEPREVARLARRGMYVRVSIKAPGPEWFERATGADPRGLDLQLRALEHLAGEGLTPGLHFRAAVVLGTAPLPEYTHLLERLAEIHPLLAEEVEWETITVYPHVEKLMRARRFKPYPPTRRP